MKKQDSQDKCFPREGESLPVTGQVQQGHFWRSSPPSVS